MLIIASFILGLLTDWWFLPLLAGLVGEVAHLASSPTYREQLAHVDGAKPAAVLATVALTALCVGAFFAGRLVVGLL